MSALRGGAPSVASTVKMPTIMEVIGQVINKLLKTEFFTTHIAEERNGNGLVTAFYENVPVEKWKNTSRSILPTMPIKLIKNMGIYQINKPGCSHDPFIPMPNGMAAYLHTERIINKLLDQTFYEHIQHFVVYSKDLTVEKVNTVEMQLIVSDINSLSIYDPLPVPADMELDVIRAAYELLSGQAIPDKHIDSNSEYKQSRQ